MDWYRNYREKELKYIQWRTYFPTCFLVSKKAKQSFLNLRHKNTRKRYLRFKGKFFNYGIFYVHTLRKKRKIMKKMNSTTP